MVVVVVDSVVVGVSFGAVGIQGYLTVVVVVVGSFGAVGMIHGGLFVVVGVSFGTVGVFPGTVVVVVPFNLGLFHGGGVAVTEQSYGSGSGVPQSHGSLH